MTNDLVETADRLRRTWHGAYGPREGWVLPFNAFDAMPWTVRCELFTMDPR